MVPENIEFKPLSGCEQIRNEVTLCFCFRSTRLKMKAALWALRVCIVCILLGSGGGSVWNQDELVLRLVFGR